MMEQLVKLDDKELLLWYSYFKDRFDFQKEWSEASRQHNDQVSAIESDSNAEEYLLRMSTISAILENRYTKYNQ